MKRLAIIIGILIGAVAIGILSLPLILSSDLVRGKILSHLTTLTGSEVSFRGDPAVSFNPFLGIELSDLKIQNPHENDQESPLLRVESVKAKLDIIPALLGDIEITEYQLIRPELTLTRKPDGKSSWSFTSGTLHEALVAAQETLNENDNPVEITAKMGRFNIQDGTIIYQNPSTNKQQRFAGVTGTVNWDDTSSEMDFAVDAVWRNETTRLEMNIADPLKIFAGGQSGISAKFNSVPLSFEITGQANMLSNLFVEGEIEAETPSISRLAEFLDTGIDNIGIIGAWSAAGKLNATWDTVLLSEATLQINDQSATGVVRFASTPTGNRKLDGTLAFDQIKLADYLQSNDNSQQKIETAAPVNLDIDLRISANSVDTGRFELANVAATIRSNKTGWQFDIGNAEAFDGTLVAQIASEVADAGTLLSIKFNTKESDAKALESLIGEQNWAIAGTVDLKGDLRTYLRSPTLSSLKLNGELGVTSKNGTIEGINISQVFDSLTKGQFGVVTSETSDGETDYETFDLKVFLSNSIASISKASLHTGDAQIQLLGNADLAKGTLAIRAQRLGEDGPIPGRIIIGGTLSDPLVTIRSVPEPLNVHPEKEDKEEGLEDTVEETEKQEAG